MTSFLACVEPDDMIIQSERNTDLSHRLLDSAAASLQRTKSDRTSIVPDAARNIY